MPEKRPKSHEIPPDSPEYTEAWARDLMSIAGKREARRVLADYERLASDKSIPKAEREAAAERAAAIKRFL